MMDKQTDGQTEITTLYIIDILTNPISVIITAVELWPDMLRSPPSGR